MLDVGGGSGRFLKFVKDKYPEFDPTLIEVRRAFMNMRASVIIDTVSQ